MTTLARLYCAEGDSSEEHLARVLAEASELMSPQRTLVDCCGHEIPVKASPAWYRGRVADYAPDQLRFTVAGNAVEIGVEP